MDSKVYTFLIPFRLVRNIITLKLTTPKMFAAGVILAVHELFASDGILKLPM
jgi:hypothetical protein